MTTPPDSTALAALVRRVADGDVDGVDDIGVTEEGGDLSPTELRREAVTGVLTRLRDGLLEPEAAQRWASFVRHGFVVGAAASPDAPIVVDTDPDDAESITDALDALDRLDDVGEGTLGPEQIDELLAALDGGG